MTLALAIGLLPVAASCGSSHASPVRHLSRCPAGRGDASQSQGGSTAAGGSGNQNGARADASGSATGDSSTSLPGAAPGATGSSGRGGCSGGDYRTSDDAGTGSGGGNR